MNNARYIVAGSFINGSGAAVQRNVFLAVKEGIITAIGPAADLPGDDGSAVDDFSHCTILPALVDCSVSLSRSPSVDPKVRASYEEADPAKKAAMVEQHIRYCHGHGVLGVADSDDITGLAGQYQDRMTGASILEIRTSGRLCRSWDTVVSNPDGADFLKLVYSTSIGEEESPYPGLGRENLHSILQQRGDKKAVVVANGRQQIDEAVEAGCDAIEQGYGMTEETLKKMADRNVLWIPSVLRAQNGLIAAGASGDVCCRFSLGYVAPGKPRPGAKDFWKKILNEHLGQLRLARKLGVATMVGTGAGSVGILHGESMVEEMKLFIKAGYSLEETICCASENGARFFAMEELGTLTIGRKATFLITRGSVQQLPRKLSYLEGIYVNGLPSTAYRKNPVKSV